MATIDKVYGTTIGECAWCLNADATASYVDICANGETVEYQVCNACHEERV